MSLTHPLILGEGRGAAMEFIWVENCPKVLNKHMQRDSDFGGVNIF